MKEQATNLYIFPSLALLSLMPNGIGSYRWGTFTWAITSTL